MISYKINWGPAMEALHQNVRNGDVSDIVQDFEEKMSRDPKANSIPSLCSHTPPQFLTDVLGDRYVVTSTIDDPTLSICVISVNAAPKDVIQLTKDSTSPK